MDLVSGCYEGVPYILWGSDKGLARPEHLLDRDGKIMHTGRYWDMEAKKHTSGDGPGGRAYSAFPLDWDADGDLDLIVGNDQGGLYMRVNEGTSKAHAFATQVVTLHAGGGDAVVPNGYAMPVAADWDGDGRWDLISGAKDGAVYWFRNAGKAGAPELEAPRMLVGPTESGEDTRGQRAQVDVVDFDGDGDLDLLVGDLSSGRVDGKSVRHGWIWLYRRVDTPEARR